MSEMLCNNRFGVFALMAATWPISLFLRDASIVDIVWGIGFILVAWSSFVQSDRDGPWAVLLPGLTTAWGLRLSAHLARRNWGQPEDYRYRALRERFGVSFPLFSLPVVFLLQAVLIWIVSLPVQLAAISPDAPPGFAWLIVGLFLWGTGLFFETVGDYQLARFKANPHNKGRVASPAHRLHASSSLRYT